jgi:hypothetical protein
MLAYDPDRGLSVIFQCVQEERERQARQLAPHLREKNPNENMKVRRPKKVIPVSSGQWLPDGTFRRR